MPKLLTDLPADVVQHILVRIQLAHHIGRAAPTCKVVSVAARNAIKVRQFSTEVVTLAGENGAVYGVSTAPDARARSAPRTRATDPSRGAAAATVRVCIMRNPLATGRDSSFSVWAHPRKERLRLKPNARFVIHYKRLRILSRSS